MPRAAFGLTSSPQHQVILEGDEADVLALDSTRERRLTALTWTACYGSGPPSAKLPEPITIQMQRTAIVTGRLVDESGKPVADALASIVYNLEDPTASPLPRDPAKTDAQGRFRVQGILQGEAVRTIEFHHVGTQPWNVKHYRPLCAPKSWSVRKR